MNISELWMRLEVLAHLRGLPQYATIKKEVEADLAEYQDSLAKPKAVPAPRDIPEGEPVIDRRA